MGVLPLQFENGQNRSTLGLTGFETFDIEGIAEGISPGKKLKVNARTSDGKSKSFTTACRIDTPMEVDYYKNDGILQYVLRALLKS